MAKIPDVMSLGARPLPQGQRPVVQDRSGELIADAMTRAGAQVHGIASDIQEQEDRFTYAKAKAAFLTADIEARRALENDLDFATHEQRYQDAMGKAREKVSSMIRSPRDRALLDQDLNLDLARGTAAVAGNARKIEVDVGRGELDASATALLDNAVLAADEATRAASLNAINDLIDGARQKGYISTEEAVNRKQAAAVSYGEAYLVTLEPEARVAALKNSKGTVVDVIPAARREVLLKQAERDAEVDADRKKNQAYQDLQRSRAEADNRVLQLYAQGTALADMPPSLLDSMNGSTRVSLMAKEEAEAKGQKVVTNPDAYLGLIKMHAEDPDAFQQVNLGEYVDKLSESDWQEMVRLKYPTNKGADLDAATFNQQLTTAAGPLKKDAKYPFTQAARNAVDVRQRELKRELTYDERQEIIDKLLISGEVKGGGFLGLTDPDRLYYETIGTEDASKFQPDQWEDIPQASKAEITAQLQSEGIQASSAAVTARWNLMKKASAQ